ncbi:hypothetical protein SLEP1_g33087 [Rubroshorea leprosula]|uniref:ABC1 atypical kinase-like domain-containing protein n=1 Tax=Rubroshorea leprosula TaxID=152421 RepID=A0AAV5KFI4_9ROSI|nr:hypothetical protein SLEP1_g33087 [Rubroshorea leprosula]
MSSWKHLGRLVHGVSLIAKEIAKRSQAIESARNGDLETLVTSSLKKALVSATDLSGLTKGKVREFSSPRPKESVVYFDDSTADRDPDSSSATASLQSPVQEQLVNVREINGNDSSKIQSIVEEKVENVDQRGELSGNLENVGLVRENELNSEDKCNGGGGGGRATGAETAPPVAITTKRRRPREVKVPATPFSRAFGFAALGAGLAWGTVQESAKRLVFGPSQSQDKQSAASPFLSEKNAERLAFALCKMRGAALKIGQMLSIQDQSLVPAPILAALDIVRQGADVMPKKQLNQVLEAELGLDWSSKLSSFDYEPMAAASIGQVHRAGTKDGMHVAMKIQYPGVADSIESDIQSVKLLLDYTNLIPKGLYLDRAMKVAREELSRECDYELEAANQKRFRDLLSNANAEGFYVPLVMDDLSSKRVLTTELVSGTVQYASLCHHFVSVRSFM